MSNLQEDEFALTLELLKKSFECKDNAKQKEIVKTLKGLFRKDRMRHFEYLIKGLTIESDQVSLDLKKSIAIYINTLLNSYRDDLGDQTLLELLNFVLQTIINKPNLGAIVHVFHKTIGLIVSSERLKIANSYLKDVFNSLQSAATAQSQPEQFLIRSQRIMGILQVLAKVLLFDNDTFAMISTQIFSIVDSFFSLISHYINTNTGVNAEFVNLLKDIFEFFVIFLKQLKNLSMMYKDVQHLFEKYGMYTWELIQLNISNTEGNGIVYFTNNSDFDRKVNVMKGKAIQFITSLLSLTVDTITDVNLVVYTSKLINLIIQTMDHFIKADFKLIQSLGEKDLNDGVNMLFFSMTLFLTRALARKPITEEFLPLLNNFVLNIVFPFLLSSPNDINEIKEEGEEYFLFISDLINDHEIKACRTSFAFLLQKICSSYPLIASSITNYILKYLEALLTDANIKNSFNQFSMALDPQSPILTIEPEYKIDFCLLIMILLEDFIVESPLYKEALCSMFLKHSNIIHSIKSVLVSDKLCLFYNVYLHLFDEQINNVYNFNTVVFNYLMGILLNSAQYEGLGHQSANAINEILIKSDPAKDLYFAAIIAQNISKIIPLIEECDVSLFFDILVYVMEKIDFNSEDELLECLVKVGKRMQKEIIACNREKEISKILNSGFEILTKVLERKQLTDDENSKVNIATFEAIVTPIVLYIKNPNKIQFEDLIIDLMTSEITSAKKIPPLPLSILPVLQLTCKKGKVLSEVEYLFLCTFFKYDTNNEYTNQSLNEILTLIYLGFQLEAKSFAIFPLLLTIGLIAKKSHLNSDQAALKSLLSKSIENIIPWDKKGFQKNNLEHSIEFNFFASLAVLCTSMIILPEATFSFLTSSNNLANFYGTLNNILKCSFFSIKLMKQIILGLCSLVHTPETQQKLIQMQGLSRVLKYILYFALRQKKEDTARVNKLMEKEIECNFLNNDVEMMDDALAELENDQEKEELGTKTKKLIHNLKEHEKLSNELLMNQIDFGYENIDEYHSFAQCLKDLDQGARLEFLENLDDNEKKTLYDICLIKKVDVQFREQTITVPRRTVRIKRENLGNTVTPEKSNDNA